MCKFLQPESEKYDKDAMQELEQEQERERLITDVMIDYVNITICLPWR
jgi:hypothetical protein